MPLHLRRFKLRGVMIVVAGLATVFAALRSEGGTCLLSFGVASLASLLCTRKLCREMVRKIRIDRERFEEEMSILNRINIGCEVAVGSIALLLIGGTLFLIVIFTMLGILLPISDAIRR